MKERCGRLKCDVLIALDFDDTLVHTDRSEDFSVLSRLRELGVELCIASRNDNYYLERQLRDLEIREHFRFIMADFRPKSIQLRHILWLYGKLDCLFTKILFVDDHLPNIERVREELPNVSCYQFGQDIVQLSQMIDLV
ncbi:MAG: hypothetical protein JW779_13630 [Candidatus Thorarchaeota archaeon]|nr:hypothetical protein [Candidatus Thorarchaeota archaeon]